MMNKADILKHIDELLRIGSNAGPTINRDAAQISQGCVSLHSLAYGPKSPQLEQFKDSLEQISDRISTLDFKSTHVIIAAQGALTNLRDEIEAGLIGSLRHQITGEVLTDFIQLARSVLNQNGDAARDVGAVLAAAAFEDTIRRMGENLAGVVGQDDLATVLKTLKDAGVIQSPQVGIAQSYLSFRNHALHANWDKIERESIHSILGFVEQLLMKHFS